MAIRFLLELPTCNSGTYQIYLDEFAKHNTEVYKIIILDNGAFHKAKDLKIPENIGLMFLQRIRPSKYTLLSKDVDVIFVSKLLKHANQGSTAQ